ncbi:hypothetical protein DdX_06662 [Ditylenchus destructor]|uniref:Uncharacterized protein n=1 Tax=Ditylenchus destructor TaxID=166010 RepID=A0AAD4N507_9BILA|nr:hypothetical protein DdX_06662 [Ditylenchus destructor]
METVVIVIIVVVSVLALVAILVVSIYLFKRFVGRKRGLTSTHGILQAEYEKQLDDFVSAGGQPNQIRQPRLTEP